jgi:hypothetical protein
MNWNRASLYWRTLGRKAQLSMFIAILFGRWWAPPPPLGQDPGDDADPVGPAPPQDPTPPPPVQPQPQVLRSSYFRTGRRYAVPEDLRATMARLSPCERVCQFTNRINTDETIATIAPRMAEQCIANPGRALWFGFDAFEAWAGYRDGGTEGDWTIVERWLRLMMEALTPHQSRAVLVELCDEPSDPNKLRLVSEMYRRLEAELGWSRHTLSTTGNTPELLATVPEVEVLMLEAYDPDPDGDMAWRDDGNAEGLMLVELPKLAARARALGKRVGLVTQCFARNYWEPDPPVYKDANNWSPGTLGCPNMRVLALELRAALKWVLDEVTAGREVVIVSHFSVGRASGLAPGARYQEHPEVGQTLLPIIEVYEARLAGQDVPWPKLPADPWPKLPPDPRPKPAKSISLTELTYKGQAGISRPIAEARRFGTVRFEATPAGWPLDGFWSQRLRFKVLRWDAKGSDGSHAWLDEAGKQGGSAPYHLSWDGWGGWRAILGVGQTPAGTVITVTATGTWAALLALEARLTPVAKAGVLVLGRCDGDGGAHKPHNNTQPCWISDATGKGRCAALGGAWPDGV